MKLKKIWILRKYPYLLVFLILCSTTIFFYLRPVAKEEEPFQVFKDESIKKFVVDTIGCQIPDWDAWDPSVKQFYNPAVGPYECSGRPSFLKVLPNGVVSLDDTIIQFYYEVPRENVSCTFKPILRDGHVGNFTIDFKYKYDSSRKLIFDVPLKYEFLKTECELVGKNEPLFIEYLTLTPLKRPQNDAQKNIRRENLKKIFNVMFLGIDSISRLQFERQFPKCFEYLKGRASTFSLRGYTKVGDNTFPNLMPLLTGHFYQYYWSNLNKTMYFDDVDFLWKEFSKKGYQTLLAEDAPDIATFDYYRSGFKNPPTDYYYRPFALAVENSDAGLSNSHQCIGSKMEMEVIYDYLKSFVTTMNHSRPFFSFVFLARLTHDYLNYARYADNPTLQLLKYLDESKITENTIIVFFSDHGIRYGPIRKTYIGQFEERMPFMHLVFPRWFARKYPQFAKNLKTNEERLTTPFDIHATMLDIMNFTGEFSKKEETPSSESPGISLFQEVSTQRTCQTAWIAPHWCTCQIEKPVSLEDSSVIRAAASIIETINRWTRKFKHKCAILKLEKVHNARVLNKLGRTRNASDVNLMLNVPHPTKSLDYIIVISASPGSGLFEATVRCNNQTEVCEVLKDVSRINRYGNQSICISNVELKKFCYCS